MEWLFWEDRFGSGMQNGLELGTGVISPVHWQWSSCEVVKSWKAYCEEEGK